MIRRSIGASKSRTIRSKTTTIQLMLLVPLPQVSPCPQLIFPSKTWFFIIYLNFQRQKSLKI